MAAPNPNTTYMTPSPSSSGNSSAKPALLAFHGSGSNSTVHTVQLARLSRLLKPHFDILSLEAPFPSAAGPGVLPFFEGCGPFKRWIPPTEKVTIDGMKRGEASGDLPPEVTTLITTTISTHYSKGGGKVIGLIGFSQGTRVVAGLLKAVEILASTSPSASVSANTDPILQYLTFSFALSVCGSYPPPLIPKPASSLLSADQKSTIQSSKIKIPTLHVQGKQDEWEWAGKLLIEGAYDIGEGKSEVVEFDMGHHYPVQQEDTEKIRDWVLETWKRTAAEAEKR